MNEKDVEDTFTTCFVDAGMKIGTGFTIGLLTSALFTKRRPWPLAAGVGLGLGLAYGNCEKSLNQLMMKGCKEPKRECKTL